MSIYTTVKEIELSSKEIKTFLSKVNMSNDVDACWEWKGGKQGKINKYGKYKGFLVHRIMHKIIFGLKHELDSMYCVKHLCNNTLCCNPFHLKEDTQSNNNIDAINDGLSNQNGIGVLTNAHVRNILWVLNYQWDCHTVTKLVKLYRVSPMTIRYIKQRKTWKHILTPSINDVPPGPKLR